MLTVILPGYSPHNKDWVLATKQNLKLPHEIIAYEWMHWQTSANLDMDSEVSKILSVVGSQQVNFIAKSVGTQVLMQVLPKVKAQVNKIILCGIPINPLEHLQGLKNVDNKNVMVFQNSQDPFMPYGLIEKYIHLINKDIKVVKKEAATHDYPYYEDFQKFIS